MDVVVGDVDLGVFHLLGVSHVTVNCWVANGLRIGRDDWRIERQRDEL